MQYLIQFVDGFLFAIGALVGAVTVGFFLRSNRTYQEWHKRHCERVESRLTTQMAATQRLADATERIADGLERIEMTIPNQPNTP